MAPPPRFLVAGVAIAALTAATVATSLAIPDHLALHLGLFLVAGGLWAATLGGLAGTAPRASDARTLVIVALLMRLPAWLAPPVHSDDVYRYAWDGRVSRAGINPYRYAPTDPALAALRDVPAPGEAPPRGAPGAPMAGEPLYPRINNRELPTIYPPAAQVVFLVAALLPLPPVVAIKLVLALADFGVLALLLVLLAGRDPRWAAAWAWSPLVAVEVGQNAHLEPLALVGLVAALWAWRQRRPWLAGALVGLAAAAKLFSAPLLLALRAPRAWAGAALAVTLVALPFISAGGAIAGSTGEFARRWRGNDGAYSLVQAATDRLVCVALGAPTVEREGPRCDAPLDLWPHTALATRISGRPDRAAVYPDELSAFAARVIVGLLLVAACAVAVRRRLVPLAAAELILGALLLLTPALKPWYVTWLLPLAALSRRPAWLALAALAPLAYVPLGAWLGGAPWRDPVWTRVLEHGACWALLAAGAYRSRQGAAAEP